MTRTGISVTEITAKTITPRGRVGTRPSFKVAKEIPKPFQTNNDTFLNSGYDRGHLTPRADHIGDHRDSKDTFTYPNATHQDPEMNVGHWAKGEDAIRDLVRSKVWERVIVATGGVFLPKKGSDTIKIKVIDDAWVHTHLFKVILAENHDKEVKRAMAAILMSNKPQHGEWNIEKYLVSVAKIEEIAGLIFFPKLPEEEAKKLKQAESWPSTEGSCVMP